MAYCRRKGIGSMVGPWHFIQVKNHLDHLLNLSLLGPPLAHHGPLYHYRGVFAQWNAMLCEHQMNNPLSMGHRNGAGYVLGKEQGLYAPFVGLIHIYDLVQVLINMKKPLSKRLFRRGLYDPMCNIFNFITHSLYDAKACGCKSRVDS